MKVLVTGGAGFIGSWIVDKFIEKGYGVVIVDNLSTGSGRNLNEKAKFYEIDIKDEKLSEIFEEERPDYVFHLAAQIDVKKSVRYPIEDARINILGSLNVLDCCVLFGVKKIIFSSTGGAIYGDGCNIPTSEKEKEKPMSPYGIAKLSVEKYLEFYKKVHGLDYVSLRYANVYGPRQNSKGEAGVISIFIDKILAGEQPVINGSGEKTRDYVFVKDVADANLLALNLSGVFNVGTGKETSVNEILKKIVENLRADAKEIHGPEIKGEQERSCLDASKLMLRGWRVNYNLDEGMKETIDWFRKNLC